MLTNYVGLRTIKDDYRSRWVHEENNTLSALGADDDVGMCLSDDVAPVGVTNDQICC